MGSVAPPPPLENGEPLFPVGYTSLAQLVSGTPSASSLYDNPIWSSGAMPTSGLFVSNMASQIPVPTAVSSIPVQPTVTVGAINVPISSSGPPLSGLYVPPPIHPHGGQQPSPPYVPPISSGAYVSATQTHATKASQNVGSVPYPGGSSIPSGSSQISYQQPLSAQIPYQQLYPPYGSPQPQNPPFTQQAGPKCSLVQIPHLGHLVKFNLELISTRLELSEFHKELFNNSSLMYSNVGNGSPRGNFGVKSPSFV